MRAYTNDAVQSAICGKGGIAGDHDRDAVVSRHVDEFGDPEAGVTHLDRMPQRVARKALGQQVEEGFEVRRIEFRGRHQLPVDGPELVLQLENAAAEKTLDRRTRVGKCATMRGVAGRLQGEDEPAGVSSRHRAKVSGFCEP